MTLKQACLLLAVDTTGVLADNIELIPILGCEQSTRSAARVTEAKDLRTLSVGVIMQECIRVSISVNLLRTMV